MGPGLTALDLRPFEDAFGPRLLVDVPMARHTAARLGGPADAFLEVETRDELVKAVELAWEHGLPYFILGGGSNVLVSDAGVRGLVLLNRAREASFDEQASRPTLWAESGANFGVLARQAAQRGLSGLEWAAGIPGTLGGAVVGNAGAHGSDMAANLVVAEILQRRDNRGSTTALRQQWPVEQLELTYRGSILKRHPGQFLVLSAVLRLERSRPEIVQARNDELVAYRKSTQPPGASMGSMFKNPPGDYAGRLIEAAGLKGKQVGAAQISPVHANFFINLGGATAADLRALIDLARETVAQKFGVDLELEIELVGDW